MKIAITGTIGSGKSTLMTIIKDMGYQTLTCDEIAHALQEPNQPGYLAITTNFKNILNEKGKIDRFKLGNIVFNDKSELKKLNTLMFPLIKAELISEMAHASLIFVEVPLLFEAHFEDLFDYSILVVADENLIHERLNKRGLNTEAIVSRLTNQMNVEDKKILADYIIENNHNLEEMKKQLKVILKEVDLNACM